MEKIEERLKAIFREWQAKIPTLHRITFEIDTYGHKEGIFFQGFVHTKRHGSCRSYEGTKGLKNLLEEEENELRKEVRMEVVNGLRAGITYLSGALKSTEKDLWEAVAELFPEIDKLSAQINWEKKVPLYREEVRDEG